MKRLTILALLLVGCVAVSCQQTEPAPTPAAGPGGISQAELNAALSDRDQQIAALKSRLAQLEARRPGPAPVVAAAGGAVNVGISGARDAFPGMPIPWEIVVTNNTGQEAVEIIVGAAIDPGLEPVDNAGGQWEPSSRTIVWRIPKMAVGETRKIVITTTATRPGRYENCVNVVFKTGTCAQVEVLQPAIACSVAAGELQNVGRPFPVTVAVANTGTGVAQGVVGELRFSSNCQPQGGAQRVDFGNISAGQRVEKTVTLGCSQPGEFTVHMTVRGNPNLTAECGTQGRVVFPALEIVKTGPKMRYIGQPIEYVIVVRSTGTVAAEAVVVRDPLPPNTRFISASAGGQLQGNTVQWSLGTLGAGEQRELRVVLEGLQEGLIRNCATVQGAGIPPKEACAETQILWVAAMHIDCIDTEDPVEVGGETVYVIDVKNEGQKDTTQVVLIVDLPAEAEFLDCGATSQRGRYDAGNHQVIYTPVPVMRPNQVEEYKVRVRFKSAGSAVCSGQLRFAEFAKPIRSEEGTNIYE